jgi:AcrR family transcriptional regulator
LLTDRSEIIAEPREDRKAPPLRCKTGRVTAVDPAPAAARRRGRPGYDRDEVLAAAVALFNDQGYDATSVSDLAARLGLTKSAMYHHFSSKEQLLEMALGEALDGLEGVLARPEAQRGTASERLHFVLRAAVEVLLDQLPYVTLLLRVRGNSDVEREALARRRAFDHQMASLVREAQTSGSVRPDVDSAIVTRLIFGMLNSTIEWYRPTGPKDREALTHDILTVAFDGINPR